MEQMKQRMLQLEVQQKEADVRETKTEAVVNEMKALLDKAKAAQIQMETKISPYKATSEMVSKNEAKPQPTNGGGKQ